MKNQLTRDQVRSELLNQVHALTGETLDAICQLQSKREDGISVDLLEDYIAVSHKAANFMQEMVPSELQPDLNAIGDILLNKAENSPEKLRSIINLIWQLNRISTFVWGIDVFTNTINGN